MDINLLNSNRITVWQPVSFKSGIRLTDRHLILVTLMLYFLVIIHHF